MSINGRVLQSTTTKGGRVRIEITEHGNKQIDKLLAEMPQDLREKQIRTALHKAGKVVVNRAKQLVPQPGYEGDNDEKRSLKQSIKVKVKAYKTTVCAFVGPSRPYGNHAHLIEYGFLQHFVRLGSSGVKVLRGKRENSSTSKKGKTHSDTPKQIPRRPFMRPAAITTQDQQEAAFIGHLKKGIGELVR